MPRQQIFVGREGQLAELTGLVQAAAAARPGVALLQGEGGAGKTRLIDELVTRMPRRTVVCRGAGVGFLGGRIPYAPLVAALRSLLSRLPAAEVSRVLGPDPSDLTLLLPELGAPPDAVSDQARLISSVSSVFDRAAELRPTLLVIDDLHYADVATLEMLAYLCAGLDRQRLAVVVAYRPDEVGEVLAEWVQDRRRGPDVREVVLGPMSLAETAEQLAGLLDGDPGDVLGPGLTSRIHARSGGNPYAAEALMRAALAGDADTLPASLREVLVRRTRACSGATAELLRMVAAAGDRVAPAVLAGVADRRGLPGDLDDALDEAVRAQLLVFESDGTVSLRHALLAEALYADLLPGERKVLHGLLADTLERFDARPATLAEHADRAGDAARSLVWSMRAARAAEDVHAYDEAHRQYERVRRLWPQVPDAEQLVGADAVQVFSKAAAMAAVCDQDATAVEIIERVRSLVQADPEANPVRLGLLEAQYARFLLDAGRTDAALVAARRAVDLVPAEPPTAARAVVVSGLVHVLDWSGGSSDWGPLADEAVEVARATGDGATIARALVIRTTVEPEAPGTLSDAREAVRLALADGTPELVGQTYSNLVDCLQCIGDGEAGVAAARDGVVAVTERGLGIRYGSWLRSQGAELCITFGWWDEAEQFLQDALRDTRHVQGSNRDYALVNRARLSALRGDVDRLDADLRQMARLPAVVELLRHEAQAESLLWRGDPDGALAAVVDAAERATARLLTMAAPLAWLGARALADVVEARLADHGDHSAHASRWAQTADVVTDLVERACGPQALPGCRPRELRMLCTAELSRHSARSGADPDPWVVAVEALDRADRPYLTAYARWRLAGALVAVRDLSGAAEALRRSHGDACRLGAAPLLAQVESLARRTRIDLRAPVEIPAARTRASNPKVAALTAREREILSHLAAGRTNGEIARALVISTKTASVHVSNILRKLDVATRYEAAELAERLGAE
jgi:DNA-binding CsgD family transcriptional regulator/tetratricopeptide (TPR) repeat protein